MSVTTKPSRFRLLALTAAVAVLGSFSAAAPPATAAPAAPQLIGVAPLVVTVKTKITSQPKSATISRYGTRTSTTLKVKAKGTKLKYTWQYRTSTKASWKTISKAKKSRYTVKASTWRSRTYFRVIVKGKKGKATSKTATVKVLYPTSTAAADAQAAFGLTGLTQGVDLSAWQYGIHTDAVTKWVGSSGFVMLRNGSGSRPANTSYTDACTGKAANTGSLPVVQDCAYDGLADAADAAGRRLGHYWFNGWINTIDPTSSQAFAKGFTPTASADAFVAHLLADGHYTKTDTDPLVLDIEAGSAYTKTVSGKKVTVKLRKWNSAEALAFLNRVKADLNGAGYKANLYVYMGANAASTKTSTGAYYWSDVAAVAKLWVASWGTDNGRIPAAQPKTGPWSTWSIWQYSANARISGSGMGALDADIAKADAWTVK